MAWIPEFIIDPSELNGNSQWQTQWTSATFIGKDFWSAEIVIPFAALACGDAMMPEWGLNLTSGLTCWAPTFGSFHRLVFYTIKHTDGNIMPILDQLIECHPHALHSIDPQAGVDIAEVKKRYGQKVCLIGNVNCGKLDTGTDQECIDSVRYALTHGMPGGGYIFSTSNCIYTGMRLERYELMLDLWRQYGRYPD